MVLLGSTGSIGVTTLKIVKRFGLEVEVLAAGSNVALLNEQIRQHRPKCVVIGQEKLKGAIKHPRVYAGSDALVEVIKESRSKLVVNALVGFSGLASSVAALTSNKELALANKESLVAAGAFLDTKRITPIDSEHFGLWYLLKGAHAKVAGMTITASGGAFRDRPLDQLEKATLEDTQKHPNWSMGQKITIDSATMVNKLFELLEARWLFGKGAYDAVIETRSILHALVHFIDGSTTAHLANADMQLPIAYALLGRVNEPILPQVDLARLGQLEFRPIQKERYGVWEIKDALLERPKLGAVVNAANEVAIERFIARKIDFGDIARIVTKSFWRYYDAKIESLEDVYAIDQEIRQQAWS